jgi:hypothetical protein
MRPAPLLLLVALVLGCGSDPTPPGPDPNTEGGRLAGQFERLADSIDAGGYSPAAEALRHAAEIVRLTGHATPVRVAIDGTERSFLAVAEQIDFPNLVCSWPGDSGIAPPPDTVSVPPPDTVGLPPIPPDTTVIPPEIDSSGTVRPDTVFPDTVHIPVDSLENPPRPPECHPEGTFSMRTVIAWEPEHLAEVVRLVTSIGSSEVESDVPDIMSELPGGSPDPSPSATPPDSGSGSGGEPGGYPGFMGEYLVRDVGSWYASAGNQSNDLLGLTGACTSNRAAFDWAEFGCEAARFRFEFSMQVDPVRYERLTGGTESIGGPEGRHQLSMADTPIEGVRLTWVTWAPPPFPPGPGPDPIPVDTTTTRPEAKIE